MNTLTPSRSYTPEDHLTWSKLFAAQKKIIAKRAPRAFSIGLEKLALDPERVPDIQAVSERVHKLSGWTLVNAKEEYLSAKDWFEAFSKKSFPVTDYIRPPHEIEYTTLPDLFHEYFGHLAYFTDPAFAEMAQAFGLACKDGDARKVEEVSKLWWFSAEFGMLREDGALKAFGAGLLSSPAEFKHAFSGKAELRSFTIADVVRSSSSPFALHSKYFVLERPEDMLRFLNEWSRTIQPAAPIIPAIPAVPLLVESARSQ